MIFKVLSRHTPTFGSLINYILNEDKISKDEPQVFTNNIRSPYSKDWEKEFMQNESFRQTKRSDQVYAYHEIISLSSDEDKKHITKELLNDIANKYLDLRGRDGITIGAVHKDTESTHIHFLTSGLKYRTGKSHGLIKPKMQELKVDLQRYHLEKHPELKHSKCGHNSGKEYQSQKEFSVRRNERSLLKDSIAKSIDYAKETATSKDKFLSILQEQGLTPYERNGILTGIKNENGIKFRFSKFGIKMDDILALDQNTKQLNTINMKTIGNGKHINPLEVDEVYSLGLVNPEVPEFDDYAGPSMDEFELTYMKLEREDIGNKLESIYEHKNDLFKALYSGDIEHWSDEQIKQFDELSSQQRNLESRMNELDFSIESDKVQLELNPPQIDIDSNLELTSSNLDAFDLDVEVQLSFNDEPSMNADFNEGQEFDMSLHNLNLDTPEINKEFDLSDEIEEMDQDGSGSEQEYKM